MNFRMKKLWVLCSLWKRIFFPQTVPIVWDNWPEQFLVYLLCIKVLYFIILTDQQSTHYNTQGFPLEF